MGFPGFPPGVGLVEHRNVPWNDRVQAKRPEDIGRQLSPIVFRDDAVEADGGPCDVASPLMAPDVGSDFLKAEVVAARTRLQLSGILARTIDSPF